MGIHEVKLISFRNSTLLTKCSWHGRFRTESQPTTDNLENRLRELDGVERRRQASMWESTNSVVSSSGSVGYHSPPTLGPPGSMAYPEGTPQPLVKQPSYGEMSTGQHISPPQFHQQPRQQFPVQHAMSFDQGQQQFQQPQQLQQSFDYGNASFGQNPWATAPGQFAAWSGYGTTPGPGTIDEENAVPPNATPWNLTAR